MRILTGRGSSEDVAKLLAEAAELSGRSARLAAEGGVAEALDLERQADRLRETAREAAAHQRVLREPPSSSGPTQVSTAEHRQSARALAITALGEIGVPSAPRALSEYVWARFGTRIDHRALPSLRRDEWRAWSSPRSMRAVYLVPALEGNRFLAVRGKLTLSDWSLQRRLIGPWSERTDHLTSTIHLARQLAWLSQVEPTAAERLGRLVALYAATVSGALSEREGPDPKKIEIAAKAELDVFGSQDAEWRGGAAERARGFLNEEQLLWGASPPRAVQSSA